RGLNWCFLHLPETVAGIALSRAWFLLHEKGGKRHKVPAHQNAENCVKPISTPQTSLGRRESPSAMPAGCSYSYCSISNSGRPRISTPAGGVWRETMTCSLAPGGAGGCSSGNNL